MIDRLRGSLAWQIVWVIAIPIAVVAIAFGFLIQAIVAQDSAVDRSFEAETSITAAATLEQSLVELQSGSRGFVITGDPEFLAGYREARASYDSEAARLEDSVMTPVGRGQAATIAQRIDAYVNEYLADVVAVARRDPAAARRIVAEGEGRRRADALQMRFDDLVGAEREAATSARDDADASADRAIAVAIVGLGLSGALVIGFGLYLRRSVIRPVVHLSRAARRIEEGELGARVPPSPWRNELGQLTDSFNRMAERLEESWQAAREAERSKDEFFALVSHELRTPLTSIIGYAELLEEVDAERLSERGRGFIEVIHRNAERQMRLVTDLLMFVSIEQGTFAVDLAPTDLERVVGHAVDDARVAADDKQIALTLEADRTPPVVADAHRLGQMIGNLLSNAIKFTPDGGTVATRLRSDAAAATIEVEDSGVGVETAELERLFEPAYRASAARNANTPGLGLGLTIVNAIVEQHGGRIQVESERGVGTTFRVELPLAALEQMS
jgi:signal transduction histidine kinase